MARINVRVEARLKERLEAEAAATGVTPSDVVREALEKHLRGRKPKARESCLDLAKRLGIVGIYKGLPKDLSTNPKYMEGFGEGE